MGIPFSLNTRSEIRLFMQALNGNWPLPAETIKAAVVQLAGIIGIVYVGEGKNRKPVVSLANIPLDKNGKPDARMILAATRALAAYNRVSLAQQKLDIMLLKREDAERERIRRIPGRPMTPEEVKEYLRNPPPPYVEPVRETAVEREERRRAKAAQWTIPKAMRHLVIERVLSLIGLTRNGQPLVNFGATGPRDIRLEIAAHRVIATLAQLGIGQQMFDLEALERAEQEDEARENAERRRYGRR